MKLTNMVFLARFMARKVSHQLDFEIAGHRNVDRNLRTFEKNTRFKSHHILKFTLGVFLIVYLMSVHLRWKKVTWSRAYLFRTLWNILFIHKTFRRRSGCHLNVSRTFIYVQCPRVYVVSLTMIMFLKIHGLKAATLIERDSNTAVLRRILRNF